MSALSTQGRGPVDTARSAYARWRTLPLSSVSLTEGFWFQKQAVNRQYTIPHGHEMLEQAGNFHNLRLAAGKEHGDYRGLLFMDSDVYKWLEAVGYELARGPDGELKRMADEAIDLVAAAQTDEGYLNSYYQVVKPDRRWMELAHSHELYCAGHLIQAAVAHERGTADTRLLGVARRFADHIDSVFGPARRPGTPGHPEIEMALVELYRHTGERRYLELAGYFIDQRGHGLLGRSRGSGAQYFQDHVPIRESATLVGHAVRALYLTTGVSDLYLETGEQALLDAVTRQWHDLTSGKLYITGGVGSRHEGEAFGAPYELPNDRAYTETCAAIASIMWNWRMLLVTGDGRFADLIERTLYNGFLSGVSLDGRHFYYVNPLLSAGGVERPEWYPCACCPPNVMRLIASVGHYVATRDATGLQVHQYAPALIDAELERGHRVSLRMETDYPWQGVVKLTIEQSDGLPWRLALRLPGWCDRPSVAADGQSVDVGASRQGYLTIERTWRKGDTVELELPMTPRLTAAHPRVDAARGSVAIERGPLVYCLEQADQDSSVNILEVGINERAPLEATWRGDLLGGVMVVNAAGYAVDTGLWNDRLYAPLGSREDAPRRPVRLAAVPYHVWANRGPGAMRVWIPRGGA